MAEMKEGECYGRFSPTASECTGGCYISTRCQKETLDRRIKMKSDMVEIDLDQTNITDKAKKERAKRRTTSDYFVEQLDLVFDKVLISEISDLRVSISCMSNFRKICIIKLDSEKHKVRVITGPDGDKKRNFNSINNFSSVDRVMKHVKKVLSL